MNTKNEQSLVKVAHDEGFSCHSGFRDSVPIPDVRIPNPVFHLEHHPTHHFDNPLPSSTLSPRMPSHLVIVESPAFVSTLHVLKTAYHFNSVTKAVHRSPQAKADMLKNRTDATTAGLFSII